MTKETEDARAAWLADKDNVETQSAYLFSLIKAKTPGMSREEMVALLAEVAELQHHIGRQIDAHEGGGALTAMLEALTNAMPPDVPADVIAELARDLVRRGADPASIKVAVAPALGGVGHIVLKEVSDSDDIGPAAGNA